MSNTIHQAGTISTIATVSDIASQAAESKARVNTGRSADVALQAEILRRASNKYQANADSYQQDLKSDAFVSLLGDTVQSLKESLNTSTDKQISVSLPKASARANLIALLIELAASSSNANLGLSGVFGVMSENASMAAAEAQKSQGLAMLAKSIVSSSVSLAGQGAAVQGSVKNYRATKLNVNDNLKAMNAKDLSIRELENTQRANKNDAIDATKLHNQTSHALDENGQSIALTPHSTNLKSEHDAVVSRDLESLIAERNELNVNYLNGNARTDLNRSQIEVKRSLGTAGANVADGSGNMAVSMQQKEETEERSESKIMDGAVEMSRQTAQKSAQMLSSLLNLLNESRRADQELGAAFSSNIKA